MIIIKCFGLKCRIISKYINDGLLYVLYQSVYVFVQHSVDEISLGQTVAHILKFETMLVLIVSYIISISTSSYF